MNLSAPNLNYFWASLMMEELYRSGVRSIGLAPGSRSSPLAEAAASHGKLNVSVYPDERMLGFRMLGEALASGRPTVAITTSGTAVANLFPAIAEAHHSEIPLIALTADRPPELRDCGANQATDQVKLFGSFVRFFSNLPVPSEKISPAFLLSTVDAALHAATGVLRGPVHLNVPFREPLAPIQKQFSQRRLIHELGDWPKNERPWIAYEASKTTVENSLALIDEIRKSQRGIILAGALESESSRAVAALATHLNWPLLPDIQSGLRVGANDETVIAQADVVLANKRFAHGAGCDLLLQFGSRFVTRRFLALAGDETIKKRVIVDDAPGRMDPLHRNCIRVSESPAAIVESLLKELPSRTKSEWLSQWTCASAAVEKNWSQRFSLTTKLSEPGVAAALSTLLNEGDGWFLGNSLSIRLAATFASSQGASLHVAANRGLSGIDGQIASAVGYAAGSGRPLTLLLGDLSALHDLNSLSLLRHSKVPLIVVVVNNDGGGIFSLLPIAESARHFEKVFGVPHGLEFSGAARMFGLPYAAPTTSTAFVKAWRKARRSGTSTLIEVRTRRADTARMVRRLVAEAAQKLDRSRV